MSAIDVQALLRQNERARKRVAKRQALLEEREKCEHAGQTDCVGLIDEEIARIEAEGPMEVEVVDIEQERQHAEAEVKKAACVAALVRARDGYQKRGLIERVALVDAELRRIAAEGKPPRKRATLRGRRAAT